MSTLNCLVLIFVLAVNFSCNADPSSFHKFTIISPDASNLTLQVTPNNSATSLLWLKDGEILLEHDLTVKEAKQHHYSSKIISPPTDLLETLKVNFSVIGSLIRPITPQDEGVYVAKTGSKTWMFAVMINIEGTLSLELTEDRAVGKETQVTCSAKGWYPPVQFKPIEMFGDNFPKGDVQFRAKLKVNTSGNTIIGTYNFTARNVHRRIVISCSIWNAMTGEDKPIKIYRVYTETAGKKHVPVVGEQCLWPPNTVSQCSSDQTPGMGCLNGQCEILHMKTCKTDTDCGFSQSSSLLCIEEHCQCEGEEMFFVPRAPFCQPSFGKLCNSDTDCTELTVCENGMCTCDEQKSFLTHHTARGRTVDVCKAVIGSVCLSLRDCTDLNERLMCYRGQCECLSTYVAYQGQCIPAMDAPESGKARLEAEHEKRASVDRGKLAMVAAILGVGIAILIGLVMVGRRVRTPTVTGRRATLEQNLAQRTIKRTREKSRLSGKYYGTKHAELYRTFSDIVQNNFKDFFSHNPKVRSSPKAEVSATSLQSFHSVGNRARDCPDFGEDSDDSLIDYIETVMERKRRLGKLHKKGSSSLLTAKIDLPANPPKAPELKRLTQTKPKTPELATPEPVTPPQGITAKESVKTTQPTSELELKAAPDTVTSSKPEIPTVLVSNHPVTSTKPETTTESVSNPESVNVTPAVRPKQKPAVKPKPMAKDAGNKSFPPAKKTMEKTDPPSAGTKQKPIVKPILPSKGKAPKLSQ